MSVAVAARQRSAATADAEPPEEPPGVSWALPPLRAPGIDHRAPGRGLVGRAHGELIQVELAEHHRPVVPEVLGDGGFIGRDELAEDLRAGGGAHALGAEEVLDAQGRAFQRPGGPGRAARIRRLGHLQRLLRRLKQIGVQRARPLTASTCAWVSSAEENDLSACPTIVVGALIIMFGVCMGLIGRMLPTLISNRRQNRHSRPGKPAT